MTREEVETLFWQLAEGRLPDNIPKKLATVKYVQKVIVSLPNQVLVGLCERPTGIGELIEQAGKGYDAYMARRYKVRA